MGGIFFKLFHMSMAAGWLIAAVLILRVLLKRAPKWTACLLWGIVVLRLICPFSVESRLSLIPSAEPIHLQPIRLETIHSETVHSETTEDRAFYENIPAIDERFPIVSDILNPVLIDIFSYEETESAAPLQVYSYVAGIIWFCGALLLLLYAFGSWLRMRHMVKEAVCCRDNIYLCDAAASPFILGIIKPRIYLPSGMDENKAAYVIRHEQAHLKRKDHWWKPLGYLLFAVYWFHPLCLTAYVIFGRDIEFACDEKVIRDMTLDEKKEYSKALLSCSRYGRVVMACPLAFGEVGVKKRIKSVLQYRKAAFWVSALAVIICIAAALCFLTNPPDKSGDVSAAAGNAETRNAETRNAETGNTGTGNAGTGNAGTESAGTENTKTGKEAGWADEETDPPYEKEETAAVAGIRVTNGNNGEQLFYSREDSDGTFKDLLQLYEQLDDTAEAEENARIGYRYCMRFYDEAGNIIHAVTPYKDGFTVDSAFYRYHGDAAYDRDSVALMNYIDLLFYPAKSTPFDEEAKMHEVVGLQIVLPENDNWIKDACYYYKSDNAIEIQYNDAILEAECTLQVVRNGIPELPDISFDGRLEESWEGWTADNQRVSIKVQRSEDGKNVLVTWKYGDCEFAIQTIVTDKNVDISPVAKTAIHIIRNL